MAMSECGHARVATGHEFQCDECGEWFTEQPEGSRSIYDDWKDATARLDKIARRLRFIETHQEINWGPGLKDAFYACIELADDGDE